MNLASVFKLSLYAATVLAGCILGAAEEGWAPYATLPVAVAGYLWSDSTRPRKRWKSAGISDRIAAVCGFIALLAAVREYFSPNLEGKLLAVSHLLVYMTWILLIQRKTNRGYWWLLALGVLQLALASILISGRATIWFGLCAVLYFCVVIWTLSVFSLHRSAVQFTKVSEANAVGSCEFSAGSMGLTLNPNTSCSIGSVQNEDGANWSSMRFVSGVGFTAATGLFMSALFFALIPRVWIAPSSLGGDDATNARGAFRSGFTDDVKLGDMGPILVSMDPVLQLRVTDLETRAPVSAEAYAERLGFVEPLLRGAVLSVYESQRWKSDLQASQSAQWLPRPAKKRMVRQDVRLEGIGSSVLFCMGYPLGMADRNGQIRNGYQWMTGVVYRSVDQSRKVMNYSVLTEWPETNHPAIAAVEMPDVVRRRYRSNGYLERNKIVPRGLDRLSALARKVVNDQRKRQPGAFGELDAARAIEAFLRDSGELTYSINLSIQDPKIDPVEDFLFNRKSGHCEYFASAMVLMLRSVGIPARLISGFKGGDYHADSGAFIVQQRHSHAWCEAWIDDRAWVTFDATPVDQRSASVESVATRRTAWSDLRAQLTGIWTENVVNISLEKQEQTIYGPARAWLNSLGRHLRELWLSPNVGLEFFINLLTDPRRWLSLRGAATLLVLAGAVWFAVVAGRRLTECWSGWYNQRVKLRKRRLVDFYERFARLMQSCGLRRRETQTHQEFAQQACEIFRFRLQMAGLDFGPSEISNLFYRVRFGEQPLPEEEVRRVDDLLSRMELLLSSPEQN